MITIAVGVALGILLAAALLASFRWLARVVPTIFHKGDGNRLLVWGLALFALVSLDDLNKFNAGTLVISNSYSLALYGATLVGRFVGALFFVALFVYLWRFIKAAWRDLRSRRAPPVIQDPRTRR